MLGQRVIVTVIILPLAILMIYFGGFFYQGLIILFLAAAAWEYMRLLNRMNLHPAKLLVMAGVIALGVSRALFGFSYSSAILTIMLLSLAAWHIMQYEQKETSPAADFGASISVFMYIGFLGSYLLSLRALPNGMWWTFLVLPTVWFSDSGAYIIGTLIGKHKIAPKTSPNKTWEGYFGGVITGVLASLGLVLLYNRTFEAGLTVTPVEGALLGLAISLLITLGDLTESMIKRQSGEKDSGKLMPGHGGVFDRLDSLFWAAPIGYYLIFYLFIK